MVPIANRTSHSHPTLSGGGPVPIGVAAPPLPNILPSAKPIPSSYSTGTKFQSSHTANVVGEAQYTSSHANKGSHQVNFLSVSSNEFFNLLFFYAQVHSCHFVYIIIFTQ